MPEPTYGEIVRKMPGAVEARFPAPGPAVQGRTEVHQHLHFHAAPVAAPADDPAARSTRDDGVLSWFMPYFVVAILSLIVVGGVVGMVMAVAVVVFGMIMGLIQAVMGMVVTVAIAAVCVILAMGEIRGTSRKGKK